MFNPKDFKDITEELKRILSKVPRQDKPTRPSTINMQEVNGVWMRK